MRIRLFLLGGIISLLSICGFSEAKTITLTSDGYGYTPSSVSSLNGTFTIKSYECSYEDCALMIRKNSTIHDACQVVFRNGGLNRDSCTVNFKEKTLFTYDGSSNSFSKIVLNDGVYDIYDDGFIPLVTNLSNTVFEFIPYLVYVGIGILVALIGFVAIKWLMNRLGIKVKSVFSSKRG